MYRPVERMDSLCPVPGSGVPLDKTFFLWKFQLKMPRVKGGGEIKDEKMVARLNERIDKDI